MQIQQNANARRWDTEELAHGIIHKIPVTEILIAAL